MSKKMKIHFWSLFVICMLFYGIYTYHHLNPTPTVQSQPPPPTILVGGTEVPMEVVESGHVFVVVTINEKPLRMMADTGAGGTYLNVTAAKSVGLISDAKELTGTCKTGGFHVRQTLPCLSKYTSVKLGTAHNPRLWVTVYPDFPPNQAWGGDVLLGADFFGKFKVTFDYSKRTLRLGDPSPPSAKVATKKNQQKLRLPKQAVSTSTNLDWKRREPRLPEELPLPPPAPRRPEARLPEELPEPPRLVRPSGR